MSILEALLFTISVSQVSLWVLLQFHRVAVEAANAHEIVCLIIIISFIEHSLQQKHSLNY